MKNCIVILLMLFSGFGFAQYTGDPPLPDMGSYSGTDFAISTKWGKVPLPEGYFLTDIDYGSGSGYTVIFSDRRVGAVSSLEEIDLDHVAMFFKTEEVWMKNRELFDRMGPLLEDRGTAHLHDTTVYRFFLDGGPYEPNMYWYGFDFGEGYSVQFSGYDLDRVEEVLNEFLMGYKDPIPW